MSYDELLQRNAQWARQIERSDPGYFERLASVHKPSTLFIGCADARAPLNLVTDTGPGELFIHRNIANQVHPADTSFAASLQYAVDVLGVKDVVVCGHQGCGGVRASLSPDPAPDHVESWIAPLRMLARLHKTELDACHGDHKADKLVEINVIEQVQLLARHHVVRRAWERGQVLRIHGWIFDIPRGILVPKAGPIEAPELSLLSDTPSGAPVRKAG